MRLIRLIVNWGAILTASLWLPVFVLLTCRTEKDARDLALGRVAIWK
jgi:hypothetical protein